jgi:hypothetical protein
MILALLVGIPFPPALAGQSGEGGAAAPSLRQRVQQLQQQLGEVTAAHDAARAKLDQILKEYRENSPPVREAKAQLEEIAAKKRQLEEELGNALEESRLSPAEQLARLETRLKAARDQLAAKCQEVKAGTAPASELSLLSAQVREAEINLAAGKRAAAQAGLSATLNRPVTLEIKDTALGKAMEQVLAGSGLTARIDPRVPAETTVSVAAREVPLYRVLQAITQQAGLEYQAAEGVLSLKPQPALDVDVGRQRERSPLVPALRRPVDAQLQDATLQQAAQALSQAARLPIRVDRAAATDKRLTLDARGVPLGAVLEAIAAQTELMIAPDGQGIIVKSWPALEINGQKQIFTGPRAPWSDEWGELPFFGPGMGLAGGPEGLDSGASGLGGSYAGVRDPGVGMSGLGPPGGGAPMRGGAGTSGFGGPTTGAGMMGAGGPGMAPPGGGGPLPGMMGGSMGAAPAAASGVTVTVSASGNTVVVAEPGTNGAGEPGLWLTLYRLEGATLRRVSRAFHRSASLSPLLPMGSGPQPRSPGGSMGSMPTPDPRPMRSRGR